MAKDMIKVKYQSHVPEVGRNLNEINEYLFPLGSTTVFGQKHPNQTQTENWVLFQRVMRQSSSLEHCLPCSVKHWFCPLTVILLCCWCKKICGEEKKKKITMFVRKFWFRYIFYFPLWSWWFTLFNKLAWLGLMGGHVKPCHSTSPNLQPPLPWWSPYLKAVTATQSE